MVNVFLAIIFAEFTSSANRIYSSLKVNIADGSIPIRGVLLVIKSLKIDTFLFAITFASFKNPLEIKLRPLSGCFIKVGL